MSKLILSHWHGKFGNRMHEYAFASTYAKKYGYSIEAFSHWEGILLFKNPQYKLLEEKELCEFLKDGSLSVEDRNKEILKYYPEANYFDPHKLENAYPSPACQVIFDSLSAYNENIFLEMNSDFIKNLFEFSDLVKETDSYKHWESIKGTYDVAHLRRDDISNVEFNLNNIQGYSVISKESYFKAFEKFGFDKDNIEWVSDDFINKWHIDRPKTKQMGWNFPEGSVYCPGIIFDWLDDFLKIYFARTVFRANSSFSWWACYLSPTAKVYSPIVDKQLIYGRNGLTQEIDVEFSEGNENHWMHFDPPRKIIIP